MVVTLSPPNFIPVVELQESPITYSWDDWNPYRNLGEIRPETEFVLSKVSQRASLAFAITCAEWVVFRLHNELHDPRPIQFIEACWAFEMSNIYRCPPESHEAEWKGPARGPVDLSLMAILNTIYAIEDNSAHIEAAFSELIPLYTLPNLKTYSEWRIKALERLIAWYPIDPNNILGEAIPREALDPVKTLTRTDANMYVDSFLARPSLRSNVFLREVN